MADREMDWLIDDVPATDDPEVVRAYIRDLKAMRPRPPEAGRLVSSAERLLAELLAERRQAVA